VAYFKILNVTGLFPSTKSNSTPRPTKKHRDISIYSSRTKETYRALRWAFVNEKAQQ
jgi:hypothetical protein